MQGFDSRRNKMKKTLKWIGNIVFYTLLLVLLIFSISNMQVKNETDLPGIFGKGFVSILSGSMDSDNPDSFAKGDLVFVDILSDEQKEHLEIGQIVVFFDRETRLHIIHRIVDIQGDSILTQGDVNAAEQGTYDRDDYHAGMQVEVNPRSQVIARYTGSVKGVGSVIQELRSSSGFLLYIVFPLVALFLFELVILGKRIIDYNKAKLESKHESEKEKIRQQILDEMEKQQNQKK